MHILVKWHYYYFCITMYTKISNQRASIKIVSVSALILNKEYIYLNMMIDFSTIMSQSVSQSFDERILSPTAFLSIACKVLIVNHQHPSHIQFTPLTSPCYSPNRSIVPRRIQMWAINYIDSSNGSTRDKENVQKKNHNTGNQNVS